MTDDEMRAGAKTLAKVFAYNKTQTAKMRAEKYAKYKAGVERRMAKGITTQAEADYELTQMRLYYGVESGT